jgi:hypothetical protein
MPASSGVPCAEHYGTPSSLACLLLAPLKRAPSGPPSTPRQGGFSLGAMEVKNALPDRIVGELWGGCDLTKQTCWRELTDVSGKRVDPN